MFVKKYPLSNDWTVDLLGLSAGLTPDDELVSQLTDERYHTRKYVYPLIIPREVSQPPLGFCLPDGVTPGCVLARRRG